MSPKPEPEVLEEGEEDLKKGFGAMLDIVSSSQAQASDGLHTGRKWPVHPFHSTQSYIQNKRSENCLQVASSQTFEHEHLVPKWP